jgi:hypothetical protein
VGPPPQPSPKGEGAISGSPKGEGAPAQKGGAAKTEAKK